MRCGAVKIQKKHQFSTEAKFYLRELFVDWSPGGGGGGVCPPMPLTVLMSFVLQFLDKVEVCLCLDQCLLNPLNYSLAYLSSWNLRKQVSIQRMTLHSPPALFCCFKQRDGWVVWRDLVTHYPLNSNDCVMLLARHEVAENNNSKRSGCPEHTLQTHVQVPLPVPGIDTDFSFASWSLHCNNSDRSWILLKQIASCPEGYFWKFEETVLFWITPSK